MVRESPAVTVPARLRSKLELANVPGSTSRASGVKPALWLSWIVQAFASGAVYAIKACVAVVPSTRKFPMAARHAPAEIIDKAMVFIASIPASSSPTSRC